MTLETDAARRDPPLPGGATARLSIRRGPSRRGGRAKAGPPRDRHATTEDE